MNIRQYVSQEIKNQRLAANLSQVALAKRLKVTANTVSRWEGNVYEPSIGDLAKLAKVLRVPIRVFLPNWWPVHSAHENDKEKRLIAAKLTGIPFEKLIKYLAVLDLIKDK